MLPNLKKLRAEKGVSQRQLAEIVGISQQSINKYENHEIEPGIGMLIHLAKYFDTSVDYLVGNTAVRRKIEEMRTSDVNAEEAVLLERYRRMDDRERASIQLIAENYIKR